MGDLTHGDSPAAGVLTLLDATIAAAGSPAELVELRAELARRDAVIEARLIEGTLQAALQAADNGWHPAQLLTVPQVAERLALPKSYVYELSRRGELPSLRIGKYVRILASDLRAWIERRKRIDTGMIRGV